MFAIFDQVVPRSAAWWLVDQLRVVGRADEVTAAAAMEHALSENDPGVLLDAAERDALLEVLQHAGPDLEPLRLALVRDRRERTI